MKLTELVKAVLIARMTLKVPASRSVPRSGSPEVRDWNAAVELGETQIRARFPRP